MMLKRIIPLALFSSVVFADVATDTVETHNYWRNMLNMGQLEGQPRPQPFIGDLIWDQDIADRAQAHANKCVWQHSSGGENMYAQTGRTNESVIKRAIDQFSIEYKNYDYTKNQAVRSINNNGQIGHYTQVVWDRTKRVGCSYNYCNPLNKSDGTVMWTYATMLVCQYSPSGNYANQRPYNIVSYKTELANYDELVNDVEIPRITYNGSMYRAKMSRVGDKSNYDFKFTAYEELSKSNRTDISKLYIENNTHYLVVEFNTFTAYLEELTPNSFLFRLTSILNK